MVLGLGTRAFPSEVRRGAVLAAGVAASVLVAVAATPPAARAASGTISGGTVMSAAKRTQGAPNVFYPLPATASPRDLQEYRPRFPVTELVAPCDTPVLSAIPGTVHLVGRKSAGGTLVEVATGAGRLTTSYSFLRDIAVAEGQIVSGGQQLGRVGNQGSARGCMLRLRVATAGADGVVNPTTWLQDHVAKPVPESTVFGSTGFLVGSFNNLGASHTEPGGSAPGYPSYTQRTPKLVDYLNAQQIDVAGMQEMQKPQHRLFRRLATGYAAFPADESSDTENTMVWRKAAFSLVESRTFGVPYFNGKIKQMPYVLLKQRSTGRTAWFITVHNPVSGDTYGDQSKWRAKAVQIEHDLVVRLRASGRPVFLTGDMNDRTEVFCTMTADKLALAANSVPSATCAAPNKPAIDWVFGAGPTRFSYYTRDTSLRSAKVTDHGVVWSRAFLAG